jgi:hypothetical protein
MDSFNASILFETPPEIDQMTRTMVDTLENIHQR